MGQRPNQRFLEKAAAGGAPILHHSRPELRASMSSGHAKVGRSGLAPANRAPLEHFSVRALRASRTGRGAEVSVAFRV
jgi:hypothetical protein